eukprot:scaffold4037_cov265-Chaetoceros_neogracile.AAC.17
MSALPETKIDCSKVCVKRSTFSNEKTGDFDGAFANVAIKEGTLHRQIPLHEDLPAEMMLDSSRTIAQCTI